MKITEVTPKLPEVVYNLEGLSKDTCVALRSLLYAADGKSDFPGLLELSNRLQEKFTGDAVLETSPYIFRLKRRPE